MDQKTIDKVLRCRAIIDRHRDWLREKFDKFEADVAAETAKLPPDEKTDKNIKSIEAVLRVDEKLRADSVAEMLAALKTEGFDGLAEYEAWDDAQKFEAFWASRTLIGECDRCAGIKGDPPCAAIYREKSCFSSTISSTEQIKRLIFRKYIAQEGFFGDGKTRWQMCPDGHGWHVDMSKAKEFPFNIFWRVFG